MKKIKFFALMSAIALTGTIGFTACSSSEDATEPTTNVNPTYDGTSVRTDFAFNITKASQGTTRMSSTNVQATTGSFLGMTDMYLGAGTYQKTWFSIMCCPSFVKAGMMGDRHWRIHHKVNHDCAYPMIISDKYKKKEKKDEVYN